MTQQPIENPTRKANTLDQEPDVIITLFSKDGSSSLQRPANLAELEQMLSKPMPAENDSRWISCTGEVDELVLQMLETTLQLIPALLVIPDADMHFGGCGVVIPADQDLQVPQQVCLSFGAPLVHGTGGSANQHQHNIGFHLILVNRTLITFSKLASISMRGIGGSLSLRRNDLEGHWRAISPGDFRKSAFQADPGDDETGIRDHVCAKMSKDGGRSCKRYGSQAWYLLTAVMWAIQTEHFLKSARSASDTIDNTWERCQKADAEAYGFALMQKVYTLQERSRFVLQLSTAFRTALTDLLQEEVGEMVIPAAQISPFIGQTLVRADLRCILLAIVDCEHEFESHVTMMGTVMEMTSKRQDMQHGQVNTLLSMVATVFLPLTFLSGMYGMNFTTRDGKVAIPLLNMGNGFGGYMVFYCLCVVFALVMLSAFIRKGWFTIVGISLRRSMVIVAVIVFCMVSNLAVAIGLWFGDQSGEMAGQ